MRRKMLSKVTAIMLAGSMLLSAPVYAANNSKKNKSESTAATVEKEVSTSVSEQESETTALTENIYEGKAVDTQTAVKQEDSWNLIWNDEFDGDKLDTTKWSYQIGNGYNGWGNHEQQYYTKENVTVSDGTLKITAKEENKNGYKYTSSRIRTITDDGTKLFTAKYGKFEARIKLPAGQGLWPAFWMMPADNKYGMWPLSGEIDIMEARGRVLDTVNGTIHFGESIPFNKSLGGSYTIPQGSDITGYHVYGIEWNENTIIWYVDGNEYYRTSNWYTTGADGLADYPAPFDQKFYLILNMAVGGNYDNYISPVSKDLPGTMEVDYVRVYQKNDGYSTGNISMPEGTRDEEAALNTPVFDNGNLLADINFDTVNETAVYDAGLDYASHNWFFINSQYFGGKAELSKTSYNGKNYAAVHITEPGTQTYSVQLKQQLPLAKGYVYKVSFDAKSLGADRTIKVKPVGGSDRNYANYNNSFTANLTSELKNYEFTFMMKEDTDLNAMLEFNLGQYLGDVVIGNAVVTLVNTYNTPAKEEETTSQPEQETEDTTKAEETTEETTKNDTADSETTGNDTANEETTGNKENETVAPKEDVVEETTEDTSNDIMEGVVQNGDFSQGISAWNVFGTYYALEEKDGNTYGKIYTKPKENPWDRMWLHDGIYLTKGTSYTLTFKAKCSAENQRFSVTVEDEDYSKSMYMNFVIGTEWKTISYSFTPETDSELTLKYLLGMVSTDCKLYLDDVEIHKN